MSNLAQRTTAGLSACSVEGVLSGKALELAATGLQQIANRTRVPAVRSTLGATAGVLGAAATPTTRRPVAVSSAPEAKRGPAPRQTFKPSGPGFH